MSMFGNITRLLKRDSFAHDFAKIQEDLLTSLLVMAWIVEARDPYTGGHLWRVSRFSRQLATTDKNSSAASVARITMGGFLHDLGKIGIQDAILRKPDKVTDMEYAVLKTHPEVGMRMLAGHPLMKLVRPAILLHHETPDGRGYPFGLTSTKLPVDARIIGVCDAFDAMTSTRPYRRGMPIKKALTIIEENLGRQFDREFGTQLIALGHQGMLDSIVGHSDESIPLHDCPMCGPTLVMKKEQKVGDPLYCRNCSGEFITEEKNKRLQARPTGQKGSPRNLEPEADMELVGRLVRETARAIMQATSSSIA